MIKLKYSLITLSLFAVTGCMGNSSTNGNNETQPSLAQQETLVTAEHFNTLMQRVIPDFVAREKSNATKKGATLELLAQNYLATLSAEGSWPDVNYEQVEKPGWSPKDHLDRLVMLAAAYNEKPSEELGLAISNAITYWLDADPQSWNWWWHDIGIPNRIGRSAVMAKDALSEPLRQRIAEYLPGVPNYSPNNPNSPIPKAANRTDIALAVMNRGLLTNDSDMVGKAISDIEDTVNIGTGAGVQHDLSFHQHGPQLYTSGYGPVWFNTAAKWANLVNDLPWAFDKEKITILVDYLLDGQRWSKRHGQWDYNTMSRGISRTKTTEFSPELSSEMPEQTQMDLVASWVPERADEALAFKEHEFGGADSGMNGFKHFWRSDYSVKASDGHMFSIGMNSQRTEAAEAGNGENLKGFWLSFGSTFLMQRGNEYYNIFPVWDWKLVPGVTAPEYVSQGADWGRIMQPDVSFVGGVSNGRHGVTAMEMDIDIRHSERAHSTNPGFYNPGEGKGRTQAKKAWFSFDDEIVALGAGIQSTNIEPVNTSINQVLLNGEVTVDGRVRSMGSHELVDANWVHHDNVGYVFPSSWNGVVSNKVQTGAWKSIRRTSSADTVTKDVFTLSMSHGSQPRNATYEYVIAPGKTAEQMSAYAAAMPIDIIQNTENIQAVRHKGLNVTGIVFYQPGSIDLGSIKVDVNHASLVLINESGEQPELSVSTPGADFVDLELALQSEAYGNVTHKVLTPGGKAYGGQTVSFNWSEGPDNSGRDELKNALLEAASQAQNAPNLTLTAVADTELQGGKYENENFDIVSRWDLWVGQIADRESNQSGATKTVKSVVKFDLGSLSSKGVQKATLKLYVRAVHAPEPQVINVYALADSHWHETKVTWNNLPAIASEAIPVSVTASLHKQWVELDVTELVNGTHEDHLSLLLENLGQGYVAFASDETDGQAATLEIQQAL
ncbi:polysaccharide lyase family 8 super-sandwich domain-containing protein [Vibrio variabilis]|nr:polysaccharide lyase family 8 super-sandwich domain-containing protein [Vibrio variabilis]